jgi:hypothetical protein
VNAATDREGANMNGEKNATRKDESSERVAWEIRSLDAAIKSHREEMISTAEYLIDHLQDDIRRLRGWTEFDKSSGVNSCGTLQGNGPSYDIKCGQLSTMVSIHQVLTCLADEMEKGVRRG